MKRIEIKNLFRQKSPSLAKWTPNWVFKFLEKLICVQKINFVLDNYSHQQPIEFIESTLNYIGVSYELHGVENIPHVEKLIFASNHPLGGLDGLILAKAISGTGINIKLIVNDLLMNLEPLRPIFIPINKHGAQSIEYAKAQGELYLSNDAIITFPAGLCSRLIDGKIADPEWKRNFVIKSFQSMRVVVPTYIDGLNSKFFYKLAVWRKRMKIKANLEMILLPREMFAQRGKHINIYFGKPIYLDSSRTPAEWCEIVRESTYSFTIK